MKKTLIILLFALLISCKPTYDFKVNGLCYDINSDGKSVTVTRECFFSNSPSYPNLEGEVAIPASVKYEGTNYSVTTIGEDAFSFCTGLTSVAIPNSVTTIGEHAFSGCTGLTSIVVKNGNPKYDSRNNCNAIIETETNTLIAGCKNTTIPNSVTTIGQWAFSGCTGLTSVSIPNSVTEIGRSAFEDCIGLTSVTIPNSVTVIDGLAFFGCSGLTSITSRIQNPKEVGLGANNFDVVDKENCVLYVPAASVKLYKEAPQWNEFSNIKGF